MSRFALALIFLLTLAACQAEAPQATATPTKPPLTATSTSSPPTDTHLPPTAVPITPTEPVVLDFERTNAVVMIVSNEFDPVEFYGTQLPLINAGYTIVVAAYTLNPLPDNEGGPLLQADLLLSDVRVENYDAVIFIGNETLIYLHDSEAHRIAREAFEQGRLLAALCHGPLILGEAGILEGKRATAWFGFGSDVCRRLVQYGATCTYERVEQDGLIITGGGPEAASAFVGTIKKILSQP